MKRGIGFGASDGGSASTLAVVESFDDPPMCVPEPGLLLGMLAGTALLNVLGRRRERRRSASC